VKYLLSKGGNIDHDKFVEGTLLTFTAFTGDVEFMIYLLDQGAEIDHAMPHGGETALFHAADTNQVAAAKLLIERGADVKHRTKTDGDSELRFGKFRRKFSGEMPLHVAAVSGDEEFVKILLDAGADKTAKTMNGETPYDYAVERGRPEQIIQLLRLE
jgi:ankyrin repeat protein